MQGWDWWYLAGATIAGGVIANQLGQSTLAGAGAGALGLLGLTYFVRNVSSALAPGEEQASASIPAGPFVTV
jgi:hypothetical protein